MRRATIHTPCWLLSAKEANDELVSNWLRRHVVKDDFRHGHLGPRPGEENGRGSARVLLVVIAIVVVGFQFFGEICNLVGELGVSDPGQTCPRRHRKPIRGLTSSRMASQFAASTKRMSPTRAPAELCSKTPVKSCGVAGTPGALGVPLWPPGLLPVSEDPRFSSSWCFRTATWCWRYLSVSCVVSI